MPAFRLGTTLLLLGASSVLAQSGAKRPLTQTDWDTWRSISGTTLSVLEPRWAKGDDLCCPKQLRERDYRFDANALTFRRIADKDTPFTT